jgi:hypothetical protein
MPSPLEPPRLPYCGLTVIVDNPSRFDKNRLISGYAGQLLDNALTPLIRAQCEIRTSDVKTPYRLGTTTVLLCGKKSVEAVGLLSATLNELRGCPIKLNNISYVPTYFPQDVCDILDYEKKFNTLDEDYGSGDNVSADREDETTRAIKGHGKTRRATWKFWFEWDVRKAVKITKRKGVLETYKHSYGIRIYPDASDVLRALQERVGSTLYLDIETDRNKNLTCIGLAFPDTPIYCVPILRCDYRLAYTEVPNILRWLAVCMSRNTVVAHNSSFDLFVLAWKYRLPIGRNIYDTMLAHHRCFPEVEKSLGHCVSLYLESPYHKNEGVFEPHNHQQEEALWSYNTKDIETMIGVKLAIDTYAKNVSGLTESIAQCNASIRPYLICQMLGLAYKDEERVRKLEENDKRINQILRLLRLCTGRLMNPNSPKQIANYLYGDPPNGLGLKRPPKDLTAEHTLRKILTRQEVPAINIILAARGISHETSSFLQFNPWTFNSKLEEAEDI